VSGAAAIALDILGRYDEAVAEARRGAEMAPSAFITQFALSQALALVNEPRAGLAVCEPAVEQSGRHPWLMHVLTDLHVKNGDRVRAEAVHAELQARAVTSRISHYARVMSALALGRIDEAAEHAVNSARLGDAIGPIWYRWPGIEPLQAHPRFPEIIAAWTAKRPYDAVGE